MKILKKSHLKRLSLPRTSMLSEYLTKEKILIKEKIILSFSRYLNFCIFGESTNFKNYDVLIGNTAN